MGGSVRDDTCMMQKLEYIILSHTLSSGGGSVMVHICSMNIWSQYLCNGTHMYHYTPNPGFRNPGTRDQGHVKEWPK